MKHIRYRVLLLLTVVLLCWSSANAGSDNSYHTTDKIHVLFYSGDGQLDEKPKEIADPSQVHLSIRYDINQVIGLDVFDDAKEKMICKTDGVLPSPSKIASFTLDPKQNIKQIDFRIKLPCSAYKKKFDILIKIRSVHGYYQTRKHIPAFIRTGDGA